MITFHDVCKTYRIAKRGAGLGNAARSRTALWTTCGLKRHPKVLVTVPYSQKMKILKQILTTL